MNNNDTLNFFGIKIIVRWEHEIGDPRRRHKKKRVAKKWLKRYGTWQEWNGACSRGYAVYYDGTLYVSRRVYIGMKYYLKHPLKPEKIPHHGNN